ncbi:MAG: superoxide dismutase [Candidatus Pacebacteria bacterium]|nr:superoxide dismutase [Candidatus Paceibacterota bacterium]MBP9832400.1 superoxide dismutase [Candidatus Paceibacterota bacterium]
MYTAKKFNFGNLDGISPKQLEVHIKLYEGYVKFLNTLEETAVDLKKDSEKNAYALAEVTRRIGFEWNGMRMHEHYFSQWEGTPTPIEDPLKDALAAQYGSYESWENEFKAVGMMRGIGWALLSYDATTKNFITHFVADHELGQLNDTKTILALDMWEHAYMVDYTPAEKKTYIEAFFKNLNGAVVQSRFPS